MFETTSMLFIIMPFEACGQNDRICLRAVIGSQASLKPNGSLATDFFRSF